jgi:cell wall-associated NlpC family hydrolase
MTISRTIVLLIVCCCTLFITIVHCVQYGVVTKQAINLRNQKQDMSVPPDYHDMDPVQESQLVFQECVTIEEDGDNWISVRVPGQIIIIDGIQQAYPGYIHSSEIIRIDGTYCPTLNATRRVIVAENLVPLYDSDGNVILELSIGTTLESVSKSIEQTTVKVYLPSGESTIAYIDTLSVNEVISSEALARISLVTKQTWLVQTGKKLLGWPYAWGGRSSFDKTQIHTTFTGVDCSGFVSFVYWSALSQSLPRNAHDQYLISKNFTRPESGEFQVGDLLFLGKIDKFRMTHVMMYVGNGYLMESSESTRLMSVTKRMSVKSMKDLTYGGVVIDRGQEKRFYWGRVLSTNSFPRND